MDPKLQQILVTGLIGLIAGFIASVLLASSGGLIGSLIAGLLGAYVGAWVLGALGVNLGISNAFAAQVVTATIGAIIVIIVARIIT